MFAGCEVATGRIGKIKTQLISISLKPHPKRQQAGKPVLASLPASSLAERIVTTKALGRLSLPLKPEALP